MRIVDVGGQRAERKKWFSCFEDVTAVIYCASLSGYDESMYEDEMANVMHDSLDVFEEHVIKNRWFIETSVILFLNKVDIFHEKIEIVPITVCFDDFPQDGNPNGKDEVLQFIKHKYHSRNNSDKQIYTHVCNKIYRLCSKMTTHTNINNNNTHIYINKNRLHVQQILTM